MITFAISVSVWICIGIGVLVLGVGIYLLSSGGIGSFGRFGRRGKQGLGINLEVVGFSTGEYVEGTVSVELSDEVQAARLVISLVAIYEESRREVRRMSGYTPGQEKWDESSQEVYRYEEELPIELPLPKAFSAEIPFSFPVPRGEQVTVRTPSGGIKQGTEIPVGELAGAAIAELNWTLVASLEGTDIEPHLQQIGVVLL